MIWINPVVLKYFSKGILYPKKAKSEEIKEMVHPKKQTKQN